MGEVIAGGDYRMRFLTGFVVRRLSQLAAKKSSKDGMRTQ